MADRSFSDLAAAWVVEIDAQGAPVARGFHRFVQLPGVGDRVVLAKEGNRADVMGVLYVEHSPAAVGASTRGEEPTATVYVTWIVEDDLLNPRRNYV